MNKNYERGYILLQGRTERSIDFIFLLFVSACIYVVKSKQYKIMESILSTPMQDEQYFMIFSINFTLIHVENILNFQFTNSELLSTNNIHPALLLY